MILPYKEIFPFLVIDTIDFQMWSFFLFWPICTTNNEVLSFQIQLLKLRRNIRGAAVMLQVNPSFFAEISEK